MKRLKFLLLLAFLGLLVLMSGTKAQKGQKTNIVFYTPAEDSSGAIRRLVNQFNAENQEVQVEHRTLSWGSDDCRNFYVSAFSARDNSFDVFSGDIIWVSEFASAGWIEPLDPYFALGEREQFLPGPIEGCTYQSRIWAIPWFTDSGVLFYRSDLLNKPPGSWTELITVAQEQIAAGRIKYGYIFHGNQYEGLVCQGLELIWSNGGQIFDGDRVTINTPQAVEALQTMVDLVKFKLAPEEVLWYQEEDARLFYQDGNALFLRNWPYAWSLMNQEGSAIQGKFKLAPLPTGPRGTVGSGCLGGWNLMINSQSKHKEAAWQFMEYLTGFTAQKFHAMVGGRLPTRISVYQDPEALSVNPYYEELLPNFLAAKPRPVTPYYPAISETMQINFHQALSGLISAAEAIANIEREMKQFYPY
jgi:multiple sugar transport system substrate-binding protein